MRTSGKMSIYCLVAVFFVTSALNTYGSVLCIEEKGHVKIELVCNPCCGTEDSTCSAGSEGMAGGDHVGCENCSDFPFEELSRAQRLSRKLAAEGSEATPFSIFGGPLSTIAIAGGRSLTQDSAFVRSQAARASPEVVVLRC